MSRITSAISPTPKKCNPAVLSFQWQPVSGRPGREGAGRGRTVQPISYKRHRFPPEVIRQAVWLYFRFSLSLRDVEELMAAAVWR